MRDSEDMYKGEKISDNTLKPIATFAKAYRGGEGFEWITPEDELAMKDGIVGFIEYLNQNFYSMSDNKKDMHHAGKYNYIEDKRISFIGDMEIVINAIKDRQEFEEVMAIRGYREQFKKKLITHLVNGNKALFAEILLGNKDAIKLLREYKAVKTPEIYELLKVDNTTKSHNEISRRITEIAVEIDASIIIRVNTGVNGVAYRRLDTGDGIRYITFEVTDDIVERNSYSIETLYALHENFGNIRVEGSKMFILSYDGEYEYDMDMIHKTYGREVTVRRDKELKAAVLGDELREVTSKDGTLIIYSRPKAETISIGYEGIGNIESASVWINPRNRRLIITEHVEKCARRFIKIKGNEVNLREIIVKCEPELVIESLAICIRSFSLREYITVVFESSLTQEQYQYLVGSGIMVEAPNKTELQQDVLNDL